MTKATKTETVICIACGGPLQPSVKRRNLHPSVFRCVEYLCRRLDVLEAAAQPARQPDTAADTDAKTWE